MLFLTRSCEESDYLILIFILLLLESEGSYRVESYSFV
jgi:hypothetical protein